MNWTREQLERWNVMDLRKYAVKDLGMTYSVVNYLSKEGLIAAICDRKEFKPPEGDDGGVCDKPSEKKEDDFDDIFNDSNPPENTQPEPDTDNGEGEGNGNAGDDTETENDEGEDDKGNDRLPPSPPPPPQEDPLAKIIAMAVKKYLETDGIDPAVVMNAVEQKTDELKAIIADKLNEMLQGLDDAVEKKVDKAAKRIKTRPVLIEYKAPDKPNKDLGVQHFMFETVLTDLLALPPCDRNMFLVGPAGSGKNTIAEKIAEALELSFDTIPVGLNTSKVDLLGFMSASGQYVSTPLRKAYEHGGVFLLDEVDAGNPNVLTCINAIVANSHGGFPDGLVPRHKDFIFLAAGNTYGIGPDAQYVGRLQLDGATRDRFVFRDIPYDDCLEEAIAPNKEWLDKVRKIREAVNMLGEKVIVSPRATIKGGYLINAGRTEEDVYNAVIFRGVSSEVKSRILAQVA